MTRDATYKTASALFDAHFARELANANNNLAPSVPVPALVPLFPIPPLSSVVHTIDDDDGNNDNDDDANNDEEESSSSHSPINSPSSSDHNFEMSSDDGNDSDDSDDDDDDSEPSTLSVVNVWSSADGEEDHHDDEEEANSESKQQQPEKKETLLPATEKKEEKKKEKEEAESMSVDCIVCHQGSLPPWYGCGSCNAFLCMPCYAQLLKSKKDKRPITCPACREPLPSLSRFRVVEQLYERFKIPIQTQCPNPDCVAVCMLGELKAHEAVCEHRTYSCSETGCTERTSLVHLLRHLIDLHGYEAIHAKTQQGNDGTFITSMQLALPVARLETGQFCAYAMKLPENRGLVFIEIVRQELSGVNVMLMFRVDPRFSLGIHLTHRGPGHLSHLQTFADNWSTPQIVIPLPTAADNGMLQLTCTLAPVTTPPIAGQQPQEFSFAEATPTAASTRPSTKKRHRSLDDEEKAALNTVSRPLLLLPSSSHHDNTGDNEPLHKKARHKD